MLTKEDDRAIDWLMAQARRGADAERDAHVMQIASVLRECGMSPLDRELWAAEHGRHYAGGATHRVLGRGFVPKKLFE